MSNPKPVPNLSGLAKLRPTQTETDIINDLAISNLNQQEIAAKYDMDKSTLSRFKYAHISEIQAVKDNYTHQFTGMLVRNQEYRLKEREKDMAKLDNQKSAESVLARETIRKNTAEELGQIAPKTNIVIVPVNHQYVGVDIDNV